MQNIRYMDTASAYELWASVYDTDDNFLQALDTIEMKALVPRLLSMINTPGPWKLVDLGCGTGRNTVHLLRVPDAQIVALDLSPNMLAIARKKVEETSGALAAAPTVQFRCFDLLNKSREDEGLPDGDADAIISTLVVEHTPLSSYFETCLVS